MNTEAIIVLVQLAFSLLAAGGMLAVLLVLYRRLAPAKFRNPVSLFTGIPDAVEQAQRFGERVTRVAAGALDEAEIHYAGVECQNCGATAPASATYCPQCGHQPDGVRRATGPSVRVLVECRHCHASVASEANYCPGCGRPL